MVIGFHHREGALDMALREKYPSLPHDPSKHDGLFKWCRHCPEIPSNDRSMIKWSNETVYARMDSLKICHDPTEFGWDGLTCGDVASVGVNRVWSAGIARSMAMCGNHTN